MRLREYCFLYWRKYTNPKFCSGSVIAYLNTGVGDEISWVPVNDGKEIASGVAPKAQIRFADIDADGKDDYVVIGKAGSVTVYLNRGPNDAAPGKWAWDGPHDVAPGAPGAKGEDVLFADINGDGTWLLHCFDDPEILTVFFFYR